VDPAVTGAATLPPDPGTTPAPPATTPAPKRLGARLPLRRGMRGADVKALQRLLARTGRSIGVDGDFGPGTAAVLRDWETAGGRRANAVLSGSDLRALRADAAKGPPPSSPPPAAPAMATIDSSGLAHAPDSAPEAVKAIIAAGNEIAHKPYIYGGGHGKWKDKGYDCSGSVSYALHGAGLLDITMNSTMLESYGDASYGRWVSIYANAGHTFMVVAGIRFDTSGQRQAGTRWQQVTTRTYDGFVVRHPTGL
jgi:peptidoglycan hydrolase-like protein with peptidoglycan-binding domain